MPIGIEQWRAGIFCKRAILRVRVFYQIPLCKILVSSLCSFAHLYIIIWLSVVTVPLSILLASGMMFVPDVVLAGAPSCRIQELRCPIQRYIELTSSLTNLFPLCAWFLMRVATNVVHIHGCSVCCRTILKRSHSIVYTLLICQFLEFLSPMTDHHLNILLLVAGDVETNPGPQQENCLKFFHWNLNSICARCRI